MRSVWMALLCACGDNAHAPKLEVVAQLPPSTVSDVAFDRDNLAVVQLADGSVKRRAGDQWRSVALPAKATSKFGSDLDGAPLVTAGSSVIRIDHGIVVLLGGSVPADDLFRPMEAPSMNRYVSERGGARRTFMLASGTQTWVESPPMFVTRPVRTVRGGVYAAVPAGVEQFGADGTRSLAVTCERLERTSCADVIIAGENADGRVVVADERGLATTVGELGEKVERIPLPGEPLRAAAGSDGVVVLAKRAGELVLFIVRDGEALAVDTFADPPSMETQLAVDREGAVFIATTSLSRVSLP